MAKWIIIAICWNSKYLPSVRYNLIFPRRVVIVASVVKVSIAERDLGARFALLIYYTSLTLVVASTQGVFHLGIFFIRVFVIVAIFTIGPRFQYDHPLIIQE